MRALKRLKAKPTVVKATPIEEAVRAVFSKYRGLGRQTAWYDDSYCADMSWRLNRLNNTENASVWAYQGTRCSVSAKDADGGFLLTALIESLVLAAVDKDYPIGSSGVSNCAIVRSIEFKAGTATFFSIGPASGGRRVTLNTASGEIVYRGTNQDGSPMQAVVTPLADGWFRVETWVQFTTSLNAVDLSNYVCWGMAHSGGAGISTTGQIGTTVKLRKPSYSLHPYGYNASVPYQAITDGGTHDFVKYTQTLPRNYQDPYGTQPVTAIGQTVGLTLDLSYGLAQGPELSPQDGTFADSTGWATGAGTAIGSGKATSTAAASGTTLVNAGSIGATGKWYIVTVTVDSISGAWVRPVLFGNTLTGYEIKSTGTYKFIVYATAAQAYLQAYNGTLTSEISYFSCRELPGNHTHQPTSTSRPALNARVNLLPMTEGQLFSSTFFTCEKFTTGGPEGIGTYTRLTATSTPAVPSVGFIAPSSAIRVSFYVKKQTLTVNSFLVRNNTTAVNLMAISFNLDTGAGFGPWEVEVVGGGWYKLSLTQATGISKGDSMGLYLGSTSSLPAGSSWNIAAPSAVDLKNAHYPYQRVTSASDYADVGYPKSLQWTTDDCLFTPANVDFSASDEVTQVVPLYKASDAAGGMVTELGTGGNNRFGLMAPATNAPMIQGIIYGSTPSSATYNNSAVAAPIKLVVAHEGKISTDTSRLRINGALAVNSSSDQGSGNLANAQLFFGRRGNSTIPFNGQTFQRMIIGAIIEPHELAILERYAAMKAEETLA